MDITLLNKLKEKTKLKTYKTFLEAFYNLNFIMVTDKSRMIDAAYFYQDKLKLEIIRKDYSNDYLIKG